MEEIEIFHSQQSRIMRSIRRKCTPEEVLTVLNTLPGTGDEETFNPLKIDVFVQTLLNLGSKSFSHSFAAIGKFHYVFKVNFLCFILFSVIFDLNDNFIILHFESRSWRKQKKHKFASFEICSLFGEIIRKWWWCWLTNYWKQASLSVAQLLIGYFPRKCLQSLPS